MGRGTEIFDFINREHISKADCERLYFHINVNQKRLWNVRAQYRARIARERAKSLEHGEAIDLFAAVGG